MLSPVDIFLTIVQIDSETGGGREKNMSEWIQAFLNDRRIAYTVDEYHQIFCRIAGTKDKTLMFCAHMDTVAPGVGIKPIVHADGKITSSGDTILGADNKASLACMLWMIDQISLGNFSDHAHLEFLFTAEEEGDFPKVYHFDMSQSCAEAVFIFDKANEPNINNVVVKAGYLTCFEAFFTGKGAHSSKPELAKNVLSMFQIFLQEIKLGKHSNDSTMNIGVISGGEAPNTVPAKLSVSGDFRAFSAEAIDQLELMLVNAKEKVLNTPEFEDCSLELIMTPYCKGYEHDTTSESFVRLEQAYRKMGYDGLAMVETQSGSDASFFMHLSNPIPAYCLGDGCFHIHTVKEYTTIENLEKLAKIMKGIAGEY